MQPALGANNGMRPEGPPVATYTYPHVEEGEDAQRANAFLPLGDERPDPNDETTWFNVTDENRESFFREVAGRKLNVIQPVYQLPADQDENKVRIAPSLCLSFLERKEELIDGMGM